MKVSITQHFDAAHYLPNHPGPCSKMHGHRWLVRIVVKGSVDPGTGMVIDFQHLKSCLNTVASKLDHSTLNDYLLNPTAENLVRYISDELYFLLSRKPTREIDSVRVYETPTSWAEV